MKFLASILIPAYNCEKWLGEAIESALSQTYENKEIIIVDDGSIDNTLEIARKSKKENVKIIKQTHAGASAARNRAFRESSGDFIQYLDADDLLAPDKIERQINLLGNPNSKYIAACEWGRFLKSPKTTNFIPDPVWEDMGSVDWLICSWEGGGMMHPAAWLITRKIAEKAGPWDETLSLNDDGEYFCRVLLASQGAKFCWGARTYYRSGLTSNLASSKSHKAWESAFHALELCTKNLLSKENSSRTRHACATAFQEFVYTTYPNASGLIKKAEEKVRRFGGTNLKPPGGLIFRILSNIIGWKSTRRLQKAIYSLGYENIARARYYRKHFEKDSSD